MAKKIQPKKVGEFYTDAPTIETQGPNYILVKDGKSVDGKEYRNLYVAQQALIYWVSNNTKAPKFNKVEKAQLADDEQTNSD
jgi:UDP-N-acetylmuramyl pentapeptide synthase